MEKKRRIDWLVADLGDQQRTLAWYVARGEAGDQDAARRALQKCVASLSSEALQQNRVQMDPLLADALRKILGPAAVTGDSKLLHAARVGSSNRPFDSNRFERIWWLCVEMHGHVLGGSTRSAAAVAVAGNDSGFEPDYLAKRYRALRPAIEKYIAE